MRILRPKLISGASVLGILVFLLTSLPERLGIGIIEIKFFGYPLVWRITDLNGPTKYITVNIFADLVFWVFLAFVALFAMDRIHTTWFGKPLNFDIVLFIMLLFMPFGLLMDLVHECGHALWGTLMGGQLVYMQVMYLVVYPSFSLTPNFILGMATINSLPNQFARGVMGLGGSMTTNITSWILALAILKTNLSERKQNALKIFGFFGILDLPFYTFFPQIGLSHWIFLGGRTPEPLNGARLIGIPDSVFYIATIVSTIGLLASYFNPPYKKIVERAKINFLGIYADRRRMVEFAFGLAACGIIVSLVSGVIENPPLASIIGATYYGYPLVWRVVIRTVESITNLNLVSFVADAAFWAGVLFLISILFSKGLKTSKNFCSGKLTIRKRFLWHKTTGYKKTRNKLDNEHKKRNKSGLLRQFVLVKNHRSLPARFWQARAIR